MNMIERWRQISEMVEKSEYVTVEEFTKALNVSEATIRRDLNTMEKRGMLLRFRGGAQKTGSTVTEFQNAGSISKRLAENMEVKAKLARRAAETVENGDYIFIDESSTTFLMTDYITAKDITVITYGIMMLPKLLERNILTYVMGGFIDQCSESVIPDDYAAVISEMNFDKAYMGTYGISEKSGYTTYGTVEGGFKKALIERSKQSFMLADASKFERSAFFSIAPLEACILITNERNSITDNMKNVIICE